MHESMGDEYLEAEDIEEMRDKGSQINLVSKFILSKKNKGNQQSMSAEL